MTTHPRIQVSVDGVPVSGAFFDRLVSLTIIDREGIQSDTIDLVFNDAPPHVQSPRRGAVIEVRILAGAGGSFAGAYVIDRVEFVCLPYTIEVKGHSADLKAGMKANRTKHWDKVSVKDLVQEKAGDHGLDAKISDKVSGHVYAWIGQQDESDMHFLERLAKRHGAFFTIKNGVVLWLERGTGKTADGTAIPTVIIRRPVVVERSLRVSETDTDRFAKIKAYYRTHQAAAKKPDGEVATGDEVWDILGGKEGTSTRQAVVLKGAEDGAGEKALKQTYGSRAEALRAAKAAKREMMRAQIETNCTLVGHPDLQAGQPIAYEGIRPQVDGREFILDTVTHSYTKSGGLRTTFKGKLKAEEEGEQSAAKKSSGGKPAGGAPASPAASETSAGGDGSPAASVSSGQQSETSGSPGLAAGAGAALGGGLAALRKRRRGGRR